MNPTDYPSLREVKLFRTMSTGDRAMLDIYLKARSLAHKEVLFTAGDQGDSMVVIAEGVLEVTVMVGQETQVIAQINPGEFVGEMACIDPAPRSATVRARTKAVVFELSRANFLEVRRISPGLAASLTGEIIQEVTKRLRAVDEKIERVISSGLFSSGAIRVTSPHDLAAAMQPPPSSAHSAKSPASQPYAAPVSSERSMWQRFVDKLRGDA